MMRQGLGWGGLVVLFLAAIRVQASPALEELGTQAGPQARVAVPAASAQAAAAPISGNDVTPEYKTAFAQGAFPPAALAKLRQYKVLLVPGFMANGIFHRWTADQNGDVVLSAQQDDPVADLAEDMKESSEQYAALRSWLDANGVSEELVAINTRQTSAFNARIIARSVAASDKPVLMVTHSKGGKDLLEALLSGGDPSGKVKGWVSIQTPFFGSPVGDFWVNNPTFFKWASKYLTYMGGDPGALIGLTTKDSKVYFSAHQAAINALVAKLPLVAFASWKDPEGIKFDSKLKIFRDMMLRHGIKNDGMVPLDSAKIPGADFVAVGGIDHNATVAPTVRPLDRLRFSKALLSMLLRRL